MLNDFDDVNAILADLAEQGILEPMVEPIDDGSIEIDFWDWAEVVGVVDQFAPNDDPFWGVVN